MAAPLIWTGEEHEILDLYPLSHMAYMKQEKVLTSILKVIYAGRLCLYQIADQHMEKYTRSK